MVVPTILFPFFILGVIISGLIAYCSTGEVLTKEESEKCEKLCQDKTGYLPTKFQGPQARCFALIKEYLDAEHQRSAKYPITIDSLIKANYSMCYPLGEEMKIQYIPSTDRQSFKVNAFDRSELDSIHRYEKNRTENSEVVNQRYSECLKSESQLRWKERREGKH